MPLPPGAGGPPPLAPARLAQANSHGLWSSRPLPPLNWLAMKPVIMGLLRCSGPPTSQRPLACPRLPRGAASPPADRLRRWCRASPPSRRPTLRQKPPSTCMRGLAWRTQVGPGRAWRSIQVCLRVAKRDGPLRPRRHAPPPQQRPPPSLPPPHAHARPQVPRRRGHPGRHPRVRHLWQHP